MGLIILISNFTGLLMGCFLLILAYLGFTGSPYTFLTKAEGFEMKASLLGVSILSLILIIGSVSSLVTGTS